DGEDAAKTFIKSRLCHDCSPPAGCLRAMAHCRFRGGAVAPVELRAGTLARDLGAPGATCRPSGSVRVTARCRSSPAAAGAPPVQAGPCRRFIGKRSDPFFPDADGILHWLLDGATGNFAWTGKDTFAGANIFSIAVEAPNDMLGPGPIGAWITTSL